MTLTLVHKEAMSSGARDNLGRCAEQGILPDLVTAGEDRVTE